MARPLDWIILKIAQRCNLNCSYCYVYNRGDESWKYRPKIISLDVVAQLCDRINTHVRKYGLTSMTVEFHGGEPLLVGVRRFQEIIDLIRTRCAGLAVRFVVQSNGLLLNEEWVDFFEVNRVGVGISIDGPPEVNDLHRLDHRGLGSTRKLLDIIERLREYNADFRSGYSAVVNPRAISGGDLVRWFHAQGFSSFDLLLPDGNYVNPPHDWQGTAEYTEYMIDAFDAWYALGAGGPRIRKFELLILGMFGVEVSLDSLGGDLSKLCVVESDGGISINDVTRMCGGIYANDTLNVFENELDEHQAFFQLEDLQQLSDQCRSCHHLSSCGGGYLPHRFDGSSFRNPSFYCQTLYGLIDHIHATLAQEAVLHKCMTT